MGWGTGICHKTKNQYSARIFPDRKGVGYSSRTLFFLFLVPMEIIDKKLLDEVSAQAMGSPRLRMNYNFHQSLDDKCHRMLNAVEPGADIPIHRHPDKDESFVVLRGKVRSTTYNDDGTVIESIVLDPTEGLYGVNIGKNVWHTIEALESSVIFECKEGPFVPHEVDGILELSKK